VPVRFGDELVPAGFDGDDPVAIGAVRGGLNDCHSHTVHPVAVTRNRRGQLGVRFWSHRRAIPNVTRAE
jgi:hypothetical protein